MRHRSLLMLIAMLLLATTGAGTAWAGPLDWNGLPGLSAANGASWVREYATGLPPTTMYAATEGDGVYRSTTNGVTWSTFSSGLETVPGAKSVRTVYTSAATAYAGTSAGLFKSVAGGAWQPVAQGPEDDPKHPKKLNQAVQAVFSGPTGTLIAGVASGGVYRSSDGGATWQPPAPGNGMARSETVWSFGSFLDGVIFAATGSGIYQSLDFGSTWTLRSDGITGTILRAFADGKNPNIYYAAGTDGLFRSINAGLSWANVGQPAGTIRALKQISGTDLTRLYVGTENGVWAASTGHGPIPGAVHWRHLTSTGLGNKTIIWALPSYVNTPGTLLAGTQSNGGYALLLQPPLNTAPPTVDDTTPNAGQTLHVLSSGTWSGTPTIEFEYQWQRCTSTQASSCADIADATDTSYVLPATAQGDRFRVKVIASNDVPTFSQDTASSAITSAAGAKPGTLPGDNQSSTASIAVLVPGDTSLPQSGDTLHAQNWVFNPAATSVSFQWFVCDGAVCDPIPGATSQNYALSGRDVTHRLCVKVTGTNASGSTTLGCGGQTNEIFPQEAKLVSPTTMTGTAYVGDTLVSGVGGWAFPGTSFSRQWESCEPDGSSCQTISGAKGASYVLTGDDLGRRLRVRITADSNAPNKFPSPGEVFTPLSAVVTEPPAPPVDPAPQPARGGGGGTPAPAPAPSPDTTAPVLSGLGVVTGAALKVRSTLSEAGKLTVVIERARAGRKKGKTCLAGRRHGKTCTTYSKLASYTVAAPAGAATIALPKRKLAKGRYRLLVTPIDAAGNRGAARTLSFKMR